MIKYIDTSWDFKKANTKEFTHCFHNYPAMMIPQIARGLIEKYGKNSALLFDPYCGTGTSLVEANLQGINAIGTDLNPVARLIAKAKTTEVNIEILNEYIDKYRDFILQYRFGIKNYEELTIPDFYNIDFWFSETSKKQLAAIKLFISETNNNKVKSFFQVAFSETVRESSLTKKSEFKLVRIRKEKIDSFNPDVFEIMLAKLNRNKDGLQEFMESKTNNSYTFIYDFNTVNGIPADIIQENHIDMVLTSPPYGDSRTTVAYGQYSRLANQWLGYENASQIDKLLMGGDRNINNIPIHSNSFYKTIKQIEDIDYERSLDVKSFFEDYEKSVKNISSIIKTYGYACYVVGNRTVKGIQIPTDRITSEIFEFYGLKHIETIIRNIPNKRMPSKNSPTNIVGKKSNTMKKEYIVICQKK